LPTHTSSSSNGGDGAAMPPPQRGGMAAASVPAAATGAEKITYGRFRVTTAARGSFFIKCSKLCSV